MVPYRLIGEDNDFAAGLICKIAGRKQLFSVSVITADIRNFRQDHRHVGSAAHLVGHIGDRAIEGRVVLDCSVACEIVNALRERAHAKRELHLVRDALKDFERPVFFYRIHNDKRNPGFGILKQELFALSCITHGRPSLNSVDWMISDQETEFSGPVRLSGIFQRFLRIIRKLCDHGNVLSSDI